MLFTQILENLIKQRRHKSIAYKLHWPFQIEVFEKLFFVRKNNKIPWDITQPFQHCIDNAKMPNGISPALLQSNTKQVYKPNQSLCFCFIRNSK